MNIYWFAYYGSLAPSVRYRAIYPLGLLRKQKIRTHLVIPERTFTGAMLFLNVFIRAFLSGASSIIIIQRISSDGIYARMLKFLVLWKRTSAVYDLDDADYLERPSKNIFWFIRNCSRVMVGSCELARNLAPLNKNIVVNTSPVPEPIFTKHARAERFTIGWIGDYSGGHRQSLIEQLFPAVLELPFPVRLMLLGARNEQGTEEIRSIFQDHAHVDLHIPLDIDWADERAIQQRINQFDVGIATLQNTELHRSKSAFKLKQCMNQGIPVISTALPENEHFLRHGWNGFLCNTSADFKQRLIEIHSMDDRTYRSFSSNALMSRDRFTMSGYCDTLLSLIRSQNAGCADLEMVRAQRPCDAPAIEREEIATQTFGSMAS